MTHSECPHCGITWEGREIHLGLYLSGNYTMEQAIEAADHYGWTHKNKKKFSVNMVGVETPGYDGVSYWQCLKCGAMIDRFTGEITVKPEKEEETQDWEIPPIAWFAKVIGGCFLFWLICMWLTYTWG
jgi:hypothetical protein